MLFLLLFNFNPLFFPFLKISKVRWKNMWVQQQHIPEWGNLSSKLQAPVHLHGRCCWMCLLLPTWAQAVQAGLRVAEAGQSTWAVLWTTHLPWGRKEKRREHCGKETHEKAQQRQQSVWKWPHQQEWVDSCVEGRIQVFTRWAVLHFFFFWFPLDPNIRRYMWNDRLSMKCHVVALLHFPLGLNLCESYFVPCAAFRAHPLLTRGVECVFQTTAWSPCSKSCGTGVSTRVTNSNTQCKLVKETRICQIHPCSQVTFNRLKVHSALLLS